MKLFLKCMLKVIVLFFICGALYYNIELLYRGYSHISMFLLAGMCGITLIDPINDIFSFELDFLKQIAISTVLCTIAEGLCGLLVNVLLGLNVWDYSNIPGTFFFGQCNIFFMSAWVFIVAAGILLCDFINYYWFEFEPCPYYKINGRVILKFKNRKVR